MTALRSADGTSLLVEDSGHGEPLVLVHGGMNTTRAFDRVLPTLAGRFRCLALGRRGYGQSGDAATHSFEREAHDVLAVLAELDEPAHLLGHSSGAITALTAALTDRSRLRSLVLYEPPFPIGRPHTGPWIAAVEDAVARGDNDEAAFIGFRDAVGVPAAQIEAMRAAPGWVERTALAPAWIREARTVEGLPLGVARFTAVDTPTLLLLGSESAPHFGEAVEALDAVLPDSRVAVLAGQGHGALVADPDLVCTTVLPFLAAQ